MKSNFVSPSSAIAAEDFKKNYVCVTCWGHLVGYLVEGGTLTLCAKCGAETRGYVRKSYAERMRQESMAHKAEARLVLKDVIKPVVQTEEDLLHSLGF